MFDVVCIICLLPLLSPGLRNGDVVLSANNSPVSRPAELKAAVQGRVQFTIGYVKSSTIAFADCVAFLSLQYERLGVVFGIHTFSILFSILFRFSFRGCRVVRGVDVDRAAPPAASVNIVLQEFANDISAAFQASQR